MALSWYLPLNHGCVDFYCETCGYSYDQISVDLDEEGDWCGYVEFGCYGGESAYAKDEIVALILRHAEAGMADRDAVYELAAAVFLEEGESDEEGEISTDV